MKTFPLQVLRINEIVYQGEVSAVNAPGSGGDLTILADHETMLSSLQSGTLTITKADNTEQTIPIERGFLEASNKNVTILL